MKVKYLAALAAASVLGVTTLTSCGANTSETTPTDDAAVTDTVNPCAANPCAADPCAADPCAADPCAGN